MRTGILVATAILGGVSIAGTALAQDKTELRFALDANDVQFAAIETMVEGFEAANPDIDVVFDRVSYPTILQQLPLQLSTGEGPDVAKITDWGGLSEFYLEMTPWLADAESWLSGHGDSIAPLRPEGDDGTGIYGFMNELTITGPFINKTLFDQAGVTPPGDGAGWDEWVAAAVQVRDATGVEIALAIDRSGHRFAGPAISQGAKYFNAEGVPDFVDDGFRDMAEKIISWQKSGAFPIELWGAAGAGSTYSDMKEEFAAGNIVMYMSGSWQVGFFDEVIGDAFEWEVVQNPCGPGGCSGMPGGAAFVAMKATDYPEEVTRLMEYLASDEQVAFFSEAARSLTPHLRVSEQGLDFDVKTDLALNALNGFLEEATRVSPLAWQLQGYRNSREIFSATITRLTQVTLGEMELDAALTRMQQDFDDALAETKRSN